jgi:hypothetical protein
MFDRTKVRVTTLRSVGEKVHEIGKLYRQVRRGDVDTLEGFRMASILGIMRQCLEHYGLAASVSRPQARRERISGPAPLVQALGTEVPGLTSQEVSVSSWLPRQ